MNNRVQDGIDATMIPWVNGTGATQNGGTVQLAYGSIYGVLHKTTQATFPGVLYTAGVFRVPKVAATAFAVGETVDWHATNKNVIKAAGGVPFGVVHKAALAADTHIEIRIGTVAPPVLMRRFVGKGDTPLTIDLGTGRVPSAIFVQSRIVATGVPRTTSSIVPLTGVDAGKVTITTTAGAVDDIHDVLFVP